MNKTNINYGSCVILPTGRPYWEIVAISRRNDPTKWGIPGGKQDPGETAIDCAVREIREELDIILQPKDLVPLTVRGCYGGDGYDFWVTCFLALATFSGIYESPEEGMYVKPMKLADLANKANSPFAKYNEGALHAWQEFSVFGRPKIY